MTQSSPSANSPLVRPAAVLFDCDGVLADSEWVVNDLVAKDLSARGWVMDAEQAREHFLGMAIPTMMPLINQRLENVPVDWPEMIANAISEMMARHTPPIEGSVDVVKALVAAGVPVACASNSGRIELASKIKGLGLTEIFAGRQFSWEDVARPKPQPDMYLAAAAACGADPKDCVVVEDSLLGAKAGLAAGCRVMGFCQVTDPEIFLAIGATPFHTMAELPSLLGL
ncbi:HAD family phosphatase [Acetobacteraceae bacterium H6797]|nr:HAD family phosphatase [Acetobacteraceae bacterium H6797]